jgi:hypothetical protein
MKTIMHIISFISAFSFVSTGLVSMWGIATSDFTLALAYGTLSVTWFALMVIFGEVSRARYNT